MSFIKKAFVTVGSVLTLGLVALLIYGAITACPDVVIYDYCPADLR